MRLSTFCGLHRDVRNTPCPPDPKKTPPCHDRIRVLLGFHRECAAKSVGANGIPHSAWTLRCSRKWAQLKIWQWTSQLQFSAWTGCRRQDSYSLFSLSREAWELPSYCIFRCFRKANLTLQSIKEASFGTVCLTWPVVMAGYFLISLFRAANTSSVRPAFAAAKTRLMVALSCPSLQQYSLWTNLLPCRPE
jgi:hypothetical protein